MKLISLYGAQKAGKTTIANYMVNHYGYHRISFAQAIREMLNVVYPNDDTTPKGISIPQFNDLTMRQMLKSLGMWGRSIDPDFWVNQAEGKIISHPGDKIVIDDTRFDNELHRLRELGATVVKVKNVEAELRQKDDHESERDWPSWIPDFEVNNTPSAISPGGPAAYSITELVN